MISAIKNNRSLTFYQTPCWNFEDNLSLSDFAEKAVITTQNSAIATSTSMQTSTINRAYLQIKSSVIDRGLRYANNSAESRGGYMAENWQAETYNFDATIKKVPTRAAVPAETKLASADIVVDNQQEYSLKYLKDAKASANAQTNPGYKNQKLLVPTDQLEEAKQVLQNRSDLNTKKGRYDAADIQRDAIDRLTDRVTGPGGIKSTPLSKEQDIKLAKAIKSNESTNEEAIDDVLRETGLTKKKNISIKKNEIQGISTAIAIAAGIGLTIGFVTTLARAGVSPESIKAAAINGAKSGTEASAMAAVGYGIGRTIGEKATQTILSNIGVSATTNISKMVNMGVVGVLTISVFSIYQFTKLKIQGIATKEALLHVGKQAVVSLSILALSIAVQGVYGGAAGMIVSTGIGLILITYSVVDSVHQRRFAERIREYTIEKYTPYFA